VKRTAVIHLSIDGDNLRLEKLDGTMSFNELNWAIDWLKLQILTGKIGPQRGLNIPGMLTPNLKRLPGDVTRRLAQVS
jgi:hypothetical protein